MNTIPPFVFFGSSSISIRVLEALEKKGLLPALLVTQPDRPKGRDFTLTPPPTKIWAEKRNIPVFQPEKIDAVACEKIKSSGAELFIVASYGLILPQKLLDIPKYKTLNVHPSLLPDLRGPSPIQTSILERDIAGVSIMELDNKMDHGPILIQEPVAFSPWPQSYEIVEDALGTRGGELLGEILPAWILGTITPKSQDDSRATYCSLIEKKDGEINLAGDALRKWRTFLAYSVWPGTFFFTEKAGKKIRVKIVAAEYKNGVFTPTKVVPEGKKEMAYRDFMRG